MPGAGGLKATKYLYNVAPKDGSYSGMVTKDLVVAQLLRPKQAKYDAAKFNWIGRPNNYVAVVLVWGGRTSRRRRRSWVSADDRLAAQLIDSGTFISWSVMMPPGVPGARVKGVRREQSLILPSSLMRRSSRSI